MEESCKEMFFLARCLAEKCIILQDLERKSCKILARNAFFSTRVVFFLFFVRLQSHSDWATFLTIETTKTTSIRGQVRSAEITAKGPPFHFLLFYRNLQTRTRLKRFDFFRHCATFFKFFLMSQKSPPFEFFDILQQNMC